MAEVICPECDAVFELEGEIGTEIYCSTCYTRLEDENKTLKRQLNLKEQEFEGLNIIMDVANNEIKKLQIQLAATERRVASHIITACYFPGLMEAEFEWENIESGERVALKVPVTESFGEKLAKIVGAGTYNNAKIEKKD